VRLPTKACAFTANTSSPIASWRWNKERLRYKVRYQGTEFFVNVDTVRKPDLGCFLEVNSRTWSRTEAEEKSRLVNELIRFLGASPEEATPVEYVHMLEATLGSA